jgi:putative membrane protein
MAEFNNLLLWLHLLALFVAGGTSVGMGTMGRLMPAASPEQRLGYFKLGNILVRSGRGALVVLLITGPLMLWLKYGGFSGMSPWFHFKMAMVVVLVIANIVSGIAYKRVQKGDAGARSVAARAGLIGGLSVVLIVLAAVFAFE